jgi:hypothetical protein
MRQYAVQHPSYREIDRLASSSGIDNRVRNLDCGVQVASMDWRRDLILLVRISRQTCSNSSKTRTFVLTFSMPVSSPAPVLRSRITVHVPGAVFLFTLHSSRNSNPPPGIGRSSSFLRFESYANSRPSTRLPCHSSLVTRTLSPNRFVPLFVFKKQIIIRFSSKRIKPISPPLFAVRPGNLDQNTPRYGGHSFPVRFFPKTNIFLTIQPSNHSAKVPFTFGIRLFAYQTTRLFNSSTTPDLPTPPLDYSTTQLFNYNQTHVKTPEYHLS